MTEKDWLTKTNPMPMVRFLRRKTSDRKLRLIAVACCRRSCSYLPDKWSRNTVGVAEREAEGFDTQDALRLAELEARAAISSFARPSEQVAFAGAIGATMPKATDAARVACNWAGQLCLVLAYEQQARDPQPRTISKKKILAEWGEEAVALLRCIIGNPFKPVAADPSWLTPIVVNLAQSIYNDRAFDRMGILGDALEDAGCSNADMLNHCRQPGGHVRGCRALDLVLGRECRP
jgi:hypothetical protein